MRSKPIVGICADRKMLGVHPYHCIGEKYITAVIEGANAFAILLPALADLQPASEVLQLVDGLLFTGSYSNLEPHHYGAASTESDDVLRDPHRDATNLPLIRAAVEAGVPVMGICRGFQEMNVVFGGSLHQKVQEQAGMMDHRDKGETLDEQYGPAHPVRITEDGLLHRWYGKTEAEVNSVHGQGIDRLGQGLSVEAMAPDGLVEAFSVQDAKTFAFAVQWHPEWKHAENPLSVAIFTAFGAACRQRQQQRN